MWLANVWLALLVDCWRNVIVGSVNGCVMVLVVF